MTVVPADHNTLFRSDTLFGVCQALGEDFGFNPNWLRIVLAVLLLASPMVVGGAYIAAGLVVLVSRLVAPNPRLTSAEVAEAPDHERPEAGNEQLELAIAA